MAVERVIILALISSYLISVAYAIPGTASFYTTLTPSACFGNRNMGTFVAAANPRLYNNGAACGRRYNIRCTGGTNRAVPNPCFNRAFITVTIVDVCRGCGPNQINLALPAFQTIGNPNAGRIRIDYTRA